MFIILSKLPTQSKLPKLPTRTTPNYIISIQPDFILPIYWNILTHKWASNLTEQKSVIRPVLRILK